MNEKYILEKIRDFEFCARVFYKIKTKNRELIPFKFNIFQKKLTSIYTEIKKQNRPIRIICLKCRQIGISTWGTGMVYNIASTHKNTDAVITTDLSDHSSKMLEMVKTLWETSQIIRPMLSHSNARELLFHNPNDNDRVESPGLKSSIRILTAGSKTAGRSGTTHLLHCSEFAFWPNAGEIFTGLVSSVPFIPGSFVLIESTANGVSGTGKEFFNKWQMAKSGDSGYVPVFFGYQDNPEYTMAIDGRFKVDKTGKYGDEEFYLKNIPNITVENLQWRRWKIDNEMGSALLNPIDQFRQEYPAFAEECFIAGGRSVFSIELLMEKVKVAKEFKYEEILREFFPIGNGYLKIFSRPVEKMLYAIGADVAQGLEDGDYSTICVVDKNRIQVASARLHIDPDIFGKLLCKLGQYYNNAVLAPEINNHGYATILKIKEMRYAKIYRREHDETIATERSDYLGWITSAKSKNKMLDQFVAAVRDGDIFIKDTAVLEEMMTLFIDGSGDVELNSKDLTVACAIALQAIKQIPLGNTGTINTTELFNKEPKTREERFKRYAMDDRR